VYVVKPLSHCRTLHVVFERGQEAFSCRNLSRVGITGD
jgi:hypothetical protein